MSKKQLKKRLTSIYSAFEDMKDDRDEWQLSYNELYDNFQKLKEQIKALETPEEPRISEGMSDDIDLTDDEYDTFIVDLAELQINVPAWEVYLGLYPEINEDFILWHKNIGHILKNTTAKDDTFKLGRVDNPSEFFQPVDAVAYLDSKGNLCIDYVEIIGDQS